MEYKTYTDIIVFAGTCINYSSCNHIQTLGQKFSYFMLWLLRLN